jgi:5-hydroxyisourate hydrolase-like protein (transthyretin family)
VKRVLLLLILLLFASCDSELDLAGVEAGNATLAGVLQDADGGPIQGITVSLRKKNATVVLAKDVTDREGNFEFTGLAAGTYTVKAAISSQQVVTQTVTLKSSDSEVQVTLDASDALPVAKLPAVSDIEN